MVILNVIRSLLDRLFVIIGAFIGSQVPEFIHQYSQRLAGHVDELQRLLNQMSQSAHYSNKTLEQYIHKFLISSDPDFSNQGQFMHGMLLRWEELNQALNQLTTSSLLIRPYVFVKGIQYDIFRATLNSYQPGINFSIEGVCYVILGALIGWIGYYLVSKCIHFGSSRALAIFKQSY